MSADRFDYLAMAAVARDLVREFGAPAQVVFEGESQNASPMPWRGSDCGGEVGVPVQMAIVSSRLADLGRADKVGWCGAPESGEDLSRAASVDASDGLRYRVIEVVAVRPADVIVAYKFLLKR